MSDLIKREELLDYLRTIPIDLGYREMEDVVTFVEKMKSVNAAEVVRCKDCEYKPVGTGCNHDLEFPVHYKCPCECDDYWYSWMPKDDFFCGNGERKETDG